MSADRRLRRTPALLLAVLAALLAGCDGSGQEGNEFVFLTVDGFSTGGSGSVGVVTSSLEARNTSTLVCVTLRNNLKNPTVTAPTGLDNVLILSYTVKLTRFDGGPAPGPFTFAASFTVPAGTVSNGTISGNTANAAIVLVPAQAKNEPPLSTAGLPVAANAEVVFKGRDGRGEPVQTEGAITVSFVASGTDTLVSCGGVSAPSPSP
ncbi:MAG: hypothetical protein HYV62_04605 [Candidatus Rokubacteria bacterium]|nr:hypothetical protein [Candidatus Rokubacteria bacterium]